MGLGEEKLSSVKLLLLKLAVFGIVIAALVEAALSPQLAWRGPVYIAAGFAGILAFGLLLIQPLLISGHLLGTPLQQRKIHFWLGIILFLCVIFHVIGLWITSPPDVIDALTFTSPTPFSNWGVVAMWAVFAAAAMAIFRKRLKIGPRVWRVVHMSLVTVIAITTVVHAVLIEGTMGTFSKAMLCVCVLIATLVVVLGRLVRKNSF